MTIKHKINILVAILIFAVCTVGLFSYYGISTLAGSLNYSTSVSLPAVRNLILIDMIHDGVKGTVMQSLYANTINDQQMQQEALSGIGDHKNTAQSLMVEIKKLTLSEEVSKHILDSEKELNDYFAISENIILNGSKLQDKDQVVRSFESQFSKLEGSLEELGKLTEKATVEKSIVDLEKAKTIKNLAFIFVAIIMGIGLFASYYIAKSITSPLTKATTDFSTSSQQLQGIVEELTKSSFSLNESSHQQASALQETAASIEEISAMVKKSSESAKESLNITQISQETASRGHKVVENMQNSIHKIKRSNSEILTQMNNSYKQIGDIVELIKEISNKTKIINDIVFQTKLLSFNASVESARAGEHGRGFAVVAEEVGNLAVVSGKAAQEISVLLNDSVHRVEGIIQSTKSQVESMVVVSQSTVDDGVAIANQCAGELTKIVQHSSEVLHAVQSIAQANNEQALGIGEINKAMNQLEQVNHVNVSGAQESNQLAEKLLQQYHLIEAQTGSLKKMVGLKQAISFRSSSQTQESTIIDDSENAA